MSIINEKIAALLIRHLEGEPGVYEQAELREWLQESSLHEQIAREFIEEAALQENMVALLSKNIAWQRVQETIQENQVEEIRPKWKMSRWITAAASVILLLGAGFYLWSQNSLSQTLTNDNKHLLADIEPGHNGAILTLANGSRVVLDSLDNGVIALQSGSEVVLQNGQLAYDMTGSATGEIVYNTMTTPKGRQFNLLLPDGTRVWLNAASSIRYPTVFSGNERKVEMQGEAYFEVAKNTKMPFRVNVADKAEVEVLGTHFNVNAYENETTINTTLLEGSIKVQASQKIRPGKEVILQPGHQAQLLVVSSEQPAIEVVNNADIDQVMAWKDGIFDFHSFGLEEVMRQLERWYDIEVAYESTVPNVKLRGKMTRDVTLTGLLRNLGKLGVRCRLEGRKLVVLP